MLVNIEGPSCPLRGVAEVPGDKSISHRAALIAALAPGKSCIDNFSPGRDNRSTLSCLRRLGVRWRLDTSAGQLVVHGQGRLVEPASVLDCGNSGTTMRLLAGVLASRPLFAVLTGDGSLRGRPMDRVVRPLEAMGARIWGRAQHALAPLAIAGTELAGHSHDLPVSSAQVKSCLLLAGLSARGLTRVREPAPSRDHTELMLAGSGVVLGFSNGWIQLEGGQTPSPVELRVPGDPSAAAFLLAAAAVVPGSDVTVLRLGLNPTRTGFLEVLRHMGAGISITNRTSYGREPVGDVRLVHRPLQAVDIPPETIPSLIDELPVWAVVATQARGVSRVVGARELRFKETDRLKAIHQLLAGLGAEVEVTADGFAIEGGHALAAAEVASHGDHRMAMAAAVAALCARGETTIRDAGCVAVSFPSFFPTLDALRTGAGS